MMGTQMQFSTIKLDRFRHRNMVFYGRASTQHEAQLSALKNQMQWYDDKAARHSNWTVVDKYIDEGITGTLAKKRPSFMKMIEDAKHGKFDLIVTREVCRFARNTVDTLVVTRQLKEYGVEVYFVEDNIWTMDGDGELRLTIMATLAQEESRKISERVLAGQMISRENRVLYGTGNIIGYNRKKGETYTINPEQAETIRTIYTLYASGMGEKKIVTELTLRGMKDGNGRLNWSCIKISRILRNATYKGYICYNKSRVNNFLDKKRINNLDESSIVTIKGDFEPIVSEELWEQCQKIRRGRIKEYQMPDGETRRAGTRNPKSIWAMKLRCRCGANFQRFKWRFNRERNEAVFGYQCYYRTRNANRTILAQHGVDVATACDQVSLCEWKLELMAKRIFDQVWGNQQEAVLLACGMLSQCSRLKNSRDLSQRQTIEAQVTKLQTRMQSFSVMRADGDISKEEYQHLRKEATTEMEQLRKQLDSVEADTVCDYSHQYQQFKTAMEQMVDLSQAKISEGLIQEFVETITPSEQYTYRWKLNFGPAKDGDERCNLMKVSAYPVLKFTIDFEDAQKFRKSCDMDFRFRRNQWNDLHVEVYL